MQRDVTATAPNQRWVGNVTGLKPPQGWIFLSVILDLYTRTVVGWATSAVNDRRLALRALEPAVNRRRPDIGLVHHPDQGSQYASGDYQNALQNAGITCSMSRRSKLERHLEVRAGGALPERVGSSASIMLTETQGPTRPASASHTASIPCATWGG
ncbi:MAG: hypothetical protein EXR71_03690 [Myxococcales bacterium]|nr:hypothetical protein [Myxococcales bacterium]